MGSDNGSKSGDDDEKSSQNGQRKMAGNDYSQQGPPSSDNAGDTPTNSPKDREKTAAALPLDPLTQAPTLLDSPKKPVSTSVPTSRASIRKNSVLKKYVEMGVRALGPGGAL